MIDLIGLCIVNNVLKPFLIGRRLDSVVRLITREHSYLINEDMIIHDSKMRMSSSFCFFFNWICGVAVVPSLLEAIT